MKSTQVPPRLEDPAKPMTTFSVLAQAVTAHVTRAAEKLRQHELVAGTLTVFFHTNPHKPDRPQHSASRSVRLGPMSNHTFDLYTKGIPCRTSLSNSRRSEDNPS